MTTIRQLSQSFPSISESSTTLVGWVEKIQSFPKHTFVTLRQGAKEKVQVFIKGKVSFRPESYISISGKVVPLPEGKFSHQPFEIQTTSYEVISPSEEDFMSRCPEDASVEVTYDQRHLYLRTDKYATILKLRSLFLRALREYFESTDMTEIVPPCFTGTQCEGGATLFKIDHVGTPAYLTQSSQFYLEYAVPAVGDCYCIYPSFRAEKSHTRRHLTEFLHAETEWSGILKFDDHLDKLRHMVRGILQKFLDLDTFDLLGKFGRRKAIEEYSKMEIVTMTHRQAIEYCRQHGIYKHDETQTHFADRDDIPEAQERKMIDEIGKIVLLTKFPLEHKSFYMASDPEDPSYSLGCDVEVPGVGEVIGSGVRVSDEKELRQRLKDQGLKEEEYKEYIDLRKYGHGKTSGMGLGVDRMLTWLLGAYSIREVVTYPRYPGRLFP